MITNEQLAALKAPFPASEIHWRAGATNQDDTKAMALAYIDARAVMDRLDQVIGPMNWTEEYHAWKDKAVKAGIGLRHGDEWVWKWDGADESAFEATKGGISDAFKRAAVKWGIGRYLYGLASPWVSCQKRGSRIKLLETPKLPAWATPDGQSPPRTDETRPADSKASPAPETRPGTDSSAHIDAGTVFELANRVLTSRTHTAQVTAILASGRETGRWTAAYNALTALSA